jgi:2-oxoisovalerate ferredoxin oxidoreductase beta subunit
MTMETGFYPRFERYAKTNGHKAHTTHYCPGCGHGLIHKYIAEVIAELGIRDRTVAVSPVGCSVFMYAYLDAGNTQAAHGRAPAVAIGHKTANPDAIVISYQGDGDLAAIGLAEIIQLAQIGLPITVIFVNNAVYGMTGGQLAPTTLMDQTTTTSPEGRNRFMGQPLRMAEMIAGIEAPVFVTRVALFNNQQRTRARKAIKKAIQLQVDNRGLAFVEVLAECPLHLKMTPVEAEKWVEETMTQVFPLGVKKEVETEPWFALRPPVFEPEAVLEAVGATSEAPKRFGATFPSHLDAHDVSIKFAGSGGDGIQAVASLLCRAMISEGFDATYFPAYGPESRGGTSYADVRMAVDEVLSPAAPDPHVLVAFNSPSLSKFGPNVRPGGTILYDSTVIEQPPSFGECTDVIGVPFTAIATELGDHRVKNVVALGALQEANGLLPPESLPWALQHLLKGRSELHGLNRSAFERGRHALADLMASE